MPRKKAPKFVSLGVVLFLSHTWETIKSVSNVLSCFMRQLLAFVNHNHCTCSLNILKDWSRSKSLQRRKKTEFKCNRNRIQRKNTIWVTFNTYSLQIGERTMTAPQMGYRKKVVLSRKGKYYINQTMEIIVKKLQIHLKSYQTSKTQSSTAHISLWHFIKQLYSYSKPVLMKWKFCHNQLYPIHHRPWNTRGKCKVSPKIKPNQNTATETRRWRIGKIESR